MDGFSLKYTPWITIFLAIFSSAQNQSLNITQNNGDSNDTQSKIWHKTSPPQTHKAYCSWIISRIHFKTRNYDFIESPEFSALTNDDFKWFIRIEPNNGTNENNYRMSILLSPDSENRTVWAKCTIHLWNKKGKKLMTLETSNMSAMCVNPSTGSEQCHDRWSWNDIPKKKKYFSHKVLNISCEITFGEDFSDILHQTNRTPHQSTVPRNNFIKKLAFEWNKELNFTDIVFLVNGTEYPAHKEILAARSPYFAALFANNTKKVFSVEEEVQVFEQTLRYIYTGECEHLNELADRLIPFAVELELHDLKMICVDALTKNLKVENAIDTYLLAYENELYKLTTDAHQFITRNHDQIMNVTNWNDIVRSKLKLVAIAEYHRTAAESYRTATESYQTALWQMKEQLDASHTKVQILIYLSSFLIFCIFNRYNR